MVTDSRVTKRAAYRHYVLGLLTIIWLFNSVDRLALGITLQSIKLELHLSDVQLGLLTGLAFALFYSVMGIPIARWADRGNRVTIIVLTTLCWSVLVSTCGFAVNFAQLLLLRVAVAVGEAGAAPPAYSLIADYFDRAERPRAAALYAMGGAFSPIVGSFAAGWLNEWYGWRVTFIVLGIPGIVVGIVAWLTLREPRHSTPTSTNCAPAALQSGASSDQPDLREVVLTLWSSTTFRHLLLFLSVMCFFSYGLGQWQPAFFIRSFGMSTGELGTSFAIMGAIGGIVGMYLGGEWVYRCAARNEPLQLRLIALAMGATGLLWVMIYLSSNLTVVWVLVASANIALYFANGPVHAIIQTLVPSRMRAVAFALVFLVINLIGMGLGPLAAGALSDAYRSWAGEESLRYALMTLAPGYLWAAWHAFRASKTVAQDLAQAADAEQPARTVFADEPDFGYARNTQAKRAGAA